MINEGVDVDAILFQTQVFEFDIRLVEIVNDLVFLSVNLYKDMSF